MWMGALRSVASLAGLITALLASGHLAPSPAAVRLTNVAPYAAPAIFVSAPRQSLPIPVHDEATCAFCQAAAFAPHASAPACELHEDIGATHPELVSPDERLTHSVSSRPPRSRAPPTFRVM